MKALIIQKKKILPKAHDLQYLGKQISLPSEILETCKRINKFYTYTRYPDTPDLDLNKSEIETHIKQTEEILKWIIKQI
jgi:HEPN domain-containing protein